jgi:iron-sulfur cluster repair protein YtfE (RIC family)
MKRHPALQQLSRDHHHALVVAQRLKRADESTGEDAKAAFLKYWKADGRDHFREEEEILLPALARFTDSDQPIVKRVLVDHVRIRRLASELEARAELDKLRALGGELEQHVRREERELFPLIEQTIPERELVQLAQQLAP